MLPTTAAMMVSSLFEAMAAALVDKPSNGKSSKGVLDTLERSPDDKNNVSLFQLSARSDMAGSSGSLLKVDPDAFYDSAWRRSTIRVSHFPASLSICPPTRANHVIVSRSSTSHIVGAFVTSRSNTFYFVRDGERPLSSHVLCQ